jgi:hypothetical protein
MKQLSERFSRCVLQEENARPKQLDADLFLNRAVLQDTAGKEN